MVLASPGLASAPNTGDNGVHASASPFEGFAERTNWLATAIGDDVFGKQPVLNPIPIEMPPEEPEATPEKDPFGFPPPSRPHGGDWGLDRF